jgi:hypothetical protein
MPGLVHSKSANADLRRYSVHPRLGNHKQMKDVDGRDKPGHDE